MSQLADRSCVPCRGGTLPLRGRAVEGLLAELGGGWEAPGDERLKKEFPFRDFRTALDFVNRVGELAELEKHHPDLHLSWGRVGVEVWTHKIGGLTESDFVLAAKLDRLEETHARPEELA